ncbi:MAG: hypothetical protein KBC43_05190 [Bacteroidales bacterium]|nr:hypothetical protein [Bacteroidales bacterium]
MKINRYYKLIKIGFVLIVILMTSCDTLKKRERLVAEIENNFQENREIYNLLVHYFGEPNSYLGFAFNYKDEKIILKQEKNPIKIDSISQVINNTEVYKILVFMKNENIRDISGNKEWIKISTEESKTPCFSFWYRSDFNLDDEKVKQKIIKFKNTKTKDWIYILDDKWFIKGEACF